MQFNQMLTLALPIIALLVSQAIRQNHWPEYVNLLVAAATIVAASLATLFVQGKLTGSVYGDILLVAGFATALQSDGIAPLQQYLRDHLLNLTPPPANSYPVTSLGTKAAVPTAIQLPPNASTIPPRASQPPQGGAASVVVPPSTPGEPAK